MYSWAKPAVLVVMFAVCWVGAAEAQSPLDLQPGDRVALPMAPSGRPVVASIVQAERDWLAFQVEGGDGLVWTRRMESIDALRVSQGVSRRRSALWGALWGVYLGGGLGAVTGPVLARSLDVGVGQSVALLGAGGGATGAVVGAVVGSLLAEERWRSYLLVR